jgi:hypothetical protein
VHPVTFLAGRGIGIVLRHQLPVDAPLKLLADLGMASRAVDRLCDRVTRPKMGRVHLAVALTARHVRVTGAGKLIRIDGERSAVPR